MDQEPDVRDMNRAEPGLDFHPLNSGVQDFRQDAELCEPGVTRNGHGPKTCISVTLCVVLL